MDSGKDSLSLWELINQTTMDTRLIELPYGYGALEPVLSAETLALHHGKHLNTYVNNLAAALPGSGFEGKSLEEIVAAAPKGPVFNNAGQILNHNLYFLQFAPAPKAKEPVGKLAEAIDRTFGSFEAFKKEFSAKAAGLFGSGWVWLAATKDGSLEILQCQNADNPIASGLTPILTFDVWEHAYYVDYRNRRPEYISALWNILDWEVISGRF